MGKVRAAGITALAAIAAVTSAWAGGGGGGGGGAGPGGGGGAAGGTRAAVEPMTQAQVVGGVPQLGLKVVKHGVLVVEVADGAFDPAMDRASVIAGRYGGFIETSSTQGVKVRSGMLVIRVPAESFERAVH